MKSLFLILTLFLGQNLLAKEVTYHLKIENKSINLSGKKTVNFALNINGSIPGPTLYFTEGDTAVITVENTLDEETIIHWHGILLPNEMDGVAYLTTPPILAHSSYTYRFPIRQNGTYWYHSHTELQEQKGVLGSIVIYPKQKLPEKHDLVALLSDWTDENPDEVLRNIKKDGDYYLYKKGTLQSYGEALTKGGLSAYLSNEWIRMGGMDLSDVGYDAFLINGKKESSFSNAKKGDKIRIRLINGGASSYFIVNLAGLPFDVVASDGKDLAPFTTKEILMGMGETYDIVFTLPDNKAYELLSTCQDVTGYASLWIGSGEKVLAPKKEKPNPYFSHAGHANHSGHEGHGEHHHHSAETPFSINALKSKAVYTFPKQAPLHEIKLRLGGDMSRYIWYLNDKLVTEERTIEVNEGDRIRFVLVNESMMHHPMHLHGHFFKVLNSQDESLTPWKHTVDVPPFETRTIEFLANEKGRWLFHCHNLYHMMNGMARVVMYKNAEPPKSVEHLQHTKHANHDHDDIFFYGKLNAYSSGAENYLRLSNARWQADNRFEIKNFNTDKIENDLFFHRWLNNYYNVFVGADYDDDHIKGVVGFYALLPMMIETRVIMNHSLKPRLDLERRFQWTKSFFSTVDLRWRYEEPFDWAVTLNYAFNWDLALSVRYGDMGLGGGLIWQF